MWNKSVQMHSHDDYSYIYAIQSQGPQMFNDCHPNPFLRSTRQWPPWRKHADFLVEPLVRKCFPATIAEKSTCRSTMFRLPPLHNEAYECRKEYLESHQQQGRRRARIPFSDDYSILPCHTQQTKHVSSQVLTTTNKSRVDRSI